VHGAHIPLSDPQMARPLRIEFEGAFYHVGDAMTLRDLTL